MKLKENIGLILSIIGVILCMTLYGIFIGIPLIIIGIYFLNKKASGKEYDNKIEEKQKQINKIDQKYDEKIKEKETEFKIKKEEKQKQLNEIDQKYDEKVKEKEKQLDEKYKKINEAKINEYNDKIEEKQNQLDAIEQTYSNIERQKKEENKEYDIKIAEKQKQLNEIDETYKKIAQEKEKKIDEEINNKRKGLKTISEKIKEYKDELITLEDELNWQNHGLYEPKYDFMESESYKERLDDVRYEQKQMIKDKTAAICHTEWIIDGDRRAGIAATNLYFKQILRSFNNEAEVIINKVRHSNLEASLKRLQRSYNQLNKIYSKDQVEITEEYYNLKLDELYIAYGYKQKKQEEKEELKEQREREKEEKKIQKQLQREKEKYEDQNYDLEYEISQIQIELEEAAAKEQAKLKEEIERLKRELQENNEKIEEIEEKEISKAGYVYIISNIGSFGENVFKIGVTRRDDPSKRVQELSNASVPFKYDSHLYIFSEDAFALERELHERFETKRVNKVNSRKEFFKITMDDIKQIVEENKENVHGFKEYPDAEEYKDTLKIEQEMY
ncbi:DUF4041 domain-containing protein [Methanosphaera cuniculi]|uniref:T5orf172 domain protein n=2 Tax=Methanosphaera cuniculi TaxID=1077256 RepID=A0A2A2HFI9_9EURY|nr:DUF4041 domain-containing protein [Methanosphaera cuniculi]PAV08044.1 hypothetical protein ASJ82_05195 [Methanosphaera cuniculi]PWL08776.1 T5orf172 domain protein [Methanosphaera cuniculi]